MASRYFTTTATHIQYSGFLVIDLAGGMSVTRAPPRLAPGERAIALSVEVPKSLFRTPGLQATIKVPDDAAPEVIEAQTIAAVHEAVRIAAGEYGLTVMFAAAPPEQD